MSVRALTRLFLLTSLLWAMPLVAQRDWDAVEIRTVPLSGGVYMLMGSGGNIGLSVGVDGAFVVDDQFAPLTEKIKAAIAGVTDQPVKWVLNTHWHGDHTGGNENFGGEGALIVAHDNVYRRLNPAEFSELVGRSQQAPNAALPVVTFDEAMTFHWNGEDIHAFHVEHAHTDGDVIIHYRGSDIYHMGDTFFKGRFPFIDVDSGGNVDGVIAAADLVLRATGSWRLATTCVSTARCSARYEAGSPSWFGTARRKTRLWPLAPRPISTRPGGPHRSQPKASWLWSTGA